MPGAQQLWSTTAGNNANADPAINWREGMAPSQVNDAARAMMAAIKKTLNDISGAVLTTGGSANAYTLTTAEAFTALVDGIVLAFKVHATNTGAATLSA